MEVSDRCLMPVRWVATYTNTGVAHGNERHIRKTVSQLDLVVNSERCLETS